MSIRAITRLTGVSKTTVSKLVMDVGRAAALQSVEECDCVAAGFNNRPRLIDRILAFVNGPSQGDEQRNVIAIAVHSDAGNAIHGLEFHF